MTKTQKKETKTETERHRENESEWQIPSGFLVPLSYKVLAVPLASAKREVIGSMWPGMMLFRKLELTPEEEMDQKAWINFQLPWWKGIHEWANTGAIQPRLEASAADLSVLPPLQNVTLITSSTSISPSLCFSLKWSRGLSFMLSWGISRWAI